MPTSTKATNSNAASKSKPSPKSSSFAEVASRRGFPRPGRGTA